MFSILFYIVQSFGRQTRKKQAGNLKKKKPYAVECATAVLEGKSEGWT